ncbi:MAG: hypothetical protein H7A51_12305 [Akkermansiaceae bacterium]|nr:hypothetical protein [Akkermansiaceae bacterium]
MLMMRTMSTAVVGTCLVLVTSRAADLAQPGYAIVVQDAVYQDAGWKQVCDALQKNHPGAQVVEWSTELEEALPALAKQHPHYTAFVAPCTKVGPEFIARAHRLTRRYDDDVYTDTHWGVVTGYDAGTALSMVNTSQPITIKRVSSGTEIAMEMVDQAICYDELVANKTVQKPAGENEARQSKCPTDTTKLLADTLTDWKADLFITSGHGFRRGWQIGFRYKNGFFESENGQLFGKDLTNKRFAITSDHPRVYLPIGNCLIGCVEDKHAFAIAMMKSAGVKGMIGYTVPTWYGYAGWGCLDYFVEQPGRYTLNEAFLANQHALVHRLETSFPGGMKHNPAPGKTARTAPKIATAGPGRCTDKRDFSGLLHDRDVLAYYGDPALEAKMDQRPCAYDQTLVQEGDVYTLTVAGRRWKDTFKPVNTNGSQRGGRPVIQFLPERIKGLKKVEVISGAEFSPVITDDFILVPNPGKGEGFEVKFRVTK